MGTAAQFRNERGQALSSVVAVAAVVAVVIGLLVLFGTGGPGGSDDDGASSGAGTPSGSSSASTSSSAPVSSVPPSTATVTPPVSTPPPVTTTATRTVPQPTKTVTKTAPPVRVTTRPKPNLGPRPAVEIYNNTRERGLADRTSSRARNAGWTVSGVDNWIGKVRTTTVYYPLGMYGQAGRLSADLGIGSTKPALSNMKKDRLTVILTTDYSG